MLVACGHVDKDPVAEYRGESSASLLSKAEHALAKGYFSDAVDVLEALDSLYPFGPDAEQGQIDIVYAYYKDGQEIAALAAAERYVHLYPRGKHIDYVYYIKGLIEFTQGMTWLQRVIHADPSERDVRHMQEAFATFSYLIKHYPASHYRSAAILRMRFIRNALGQHELRVAQFYLKRKAYVAALNRANYVIDHFQGTPAISDALQLAKRLYTKLGAKAEVAQVGTILEANPK